MKASLIRTTVLLCALGHCALAQSGAGYTNFLRQVQIPNDPAIPKVSWDVAVGPEGYRDSPLPINPGGARFELWTIKNDPLTRYLLDTKYVGTYVPMAEITIQTEDPYQVVPRTRADRPFRVVVKTSGLLSGPEAEPASKAVNAYHHVQSYGSGNGEGINRDQAILTEQAQLTSNGDTVITYPLSTIPGPRQTKLRGEERFSVWSLQDYQKAPAQIASMYVQIWPVAEGAISGITSGDKYRFHLPKITIDLVDLYPDSRTYAQAYPGSPTLGKQGVVLPGSALVVYEPVPQNRTLVVDDWGSALNADGQWTIEVVTATPFGIERLAYVSFELNRSIKVNGSVTTIE